MEDIQEFIELVKSNKCLVIDTGLKMEPDGSVVIYISYHTLDTDNLKKIGILFPKEVKEILFEYDRLIKVSLLSFLTLISDDLDKNE